MLSSGLVAAIGWRGLMGDARGRNRGRRAERAVSADRPARTPDRPRPGGAASIVRQPVRRRVRSRRRRGRRDARAARRERRAEGGHELGRRVLRRRTIRYAGVEVFIGPHRRRQDHDDRQDRGAGACTARRAAGAGLGRRVPRRRHRAAAPLRRHHRRAVPGRAHAGRPAAAPDGAPRDRCWSTPPAARRATRAPARCFRCSRQVPGVRTHLVIPAGSTARDVDRLVSAHAAGLAGPRRPHEGRRGGVGRRRSRALLRDRGLRVSYLGTGQRVPEDLIRATPANLAAALLGEAGQPAGSAA